MAELEAWVWCLFHSASLPSPPAAAAAAEEGGAEGGGGGGGEGEGGQALGGGALVPKRWAKRHLFGARFSMSRGSTSLD